MTSMTEHQPAGSAESGKQRRSWPRVSLIGLAVCVVLSVVLALAAWASARSPSGDALTALILLAPVTVAGGIFGLVALISALVHYGRGRPAAQTLGVIGLALALLVGGGWLILAVTQSLDPFYRQQQAREEASARVAEQWRARAQYPSCGTLVATRRASPSELGGAEFACLRRAHAAGTPAELTVVSQRGNDTWYIRTLADRSVELYTQHAPGIGAYGDWEYHTCTAAQVQLRNARAVCRGIDYYVW